MGAEEDGDSETGAEDVEAATEENEVDGIGGSRYPLPLGKGL